MRMFAFGWAHSVYSIWKCALASPRRWNLWLLPTMPQRELEKTSSTAASCLHTTHRPHLPPLEACNWDVGSLLLFLYTPSIPGGCRWIVFGLMGSFFPPTPLPCSAIVSDSGHTKETAILPQELKPEEWAPTGIWESQLMLPDTSINFSVGSWRKHSVSNSRLIWV